MNEYIKRLIEQATKEPELISRFYREFTNAIPIDTETWIVPVKHRSVRIMLGRNIPQDCRLKAYRFTYVGRDRREVVWEIACVRVVNERGVTLYVYDPENAHYK